MSPVNNPFNPSSDNLVLGSGELMFGRFDEDGAFGGYLHMGNVETFEINTADDVLEKNESMTAGKSLYKRVTRKRDATLNITGDEFNSHNMALILMGTVGEHTQAATPVVSEALSNGKNAKKAGYYKLAKFGPYTAVTIKGGAAGAVTLTLGTDWEWVGSDGADDPTGIIRIKPTGTAAGLFTNPILASYTPTAYVTGSGFETIAGGTETLIEGKILFKPDPTTGPKMMVEVWRTSVRPDGAVGLISEEFATLKLVASIQNDKVGTYGGSAAYPLYKVTYL